MSKWQDLMPSAELVVGQVMAISWQGEDLLLYRTAQGECRALNAYCPHMGNYMPSGLAPGQSISALLRDSEIHCPFHGWSFDGLGRCTHIPAGQRVPPAVRKGQPVARCWPLRESGGQIQIAPV
ncbi:MAG: Rieske 2Fe-2S domain-containing protein [Gammaproteobacteria bacterium]|nr:Rieske 2Fe-2S domain-containing protein [Gammaproteobacteria bacterium]